MLKKKKYDDLEDMVYRLELARNVIIDKLDEITYHYQQLVIHYQMIFINLETLTLCCNLCYPMM